MIRQDEQHDLEQARPHRLEPLSFKFDRRYSQRHPVTGRVTLHRRDHDLNAYQHPICSIQLHNMSHGGLLARSEVALRDNEQVTVFFPPHAGERALDMTGHVVRCDPADKGYEIAIKFDISRAA